MRRLLYIFLLPALPVLLSGCRQASEPAAPVAPAAFFNLSQFLEQQAAQLEKEQPAVVKTVSTRQLPPETRALQQTDWQEELALFQQADISKPALRDYYSLRTSPAENSGNLVKTFEKRPGSGAGVLYQTLTTNPDGQLLQLQAGVEERNFLFYSRKTLRLWCEPGPTGSRLKAYRINGVQKLIFADSTSYLIDAKVQ